MTDEEKLWQLFFVTPEAITNVNTATVAGETTKKALEQYPVGGIVYFAKNLEDREQTVALLENTQSYAKIPLFLGVDEEGGTVSRVGSNEALGGTNVGRMQSYGEAASAATRTWACRPSAICVRSASSRIPQRPMPPGRTSAAACTRWASIWTLPRSRTLRRVRTASSATARSALIRSCARRWPV